VNSAVLSHPSSLTGSWISSSPDDTTKIVPPLLCQLSPLLNHRWKKIPKRKILH